MDERQKEKLKLINTLLSSQYKFEPTASYRDNQKQELAQRKLQAHTIAEFAEYLIIEVENGQ